jgi:hypothetical protein
MTKMKYNANDNTRTTAQVQVLPERTENFADEAVRIDARGVT